MLIRSFGKAVSVSRGEGGREKEMKTCPKRIPLSEKTGLVPEPTVYFAKWNTTSFLNATKQHFRNSVLLSKTDGSIAQHIQRFRQHLTGNKTLKRLLTTVGFTLNAAFAFGHFPKLPPPVSNQVCKRNVRITGVRHMTRCYRAVQNRALLKKDAAGSRNIWRDQTFFKSYSYS